ncbi:MAG: hypothetical protein JNM81_15335 [Rhodospirillaceae bacterium]|nr:hypothetical protein [Rhodospirillaceae bacterium]
MSPRVAAVISAILFANTLGVLVAVASFGVLRVLESLAEGLGLFPSRWGENNPEILMMSALVVAVPVVLWFVFWFYKKAIAAEIMLSTYKYNPPDAPNKA